MCLRSIFNVHLKQNTMCWIHSSIPKLLWIHFPQAFVTLDLQAFARANEREEAEWVRKAPGGDVVIRERELKERDQQIRVLLRDGKYLYELRDFDEAEDKFERVLDFDPVNDVANNYLRLINKVRGDHAVIKLSLIHI